MCQISVTQTTEMTTLGIWTRVWFKYYQSSLLYTRKHNIWWTKVLSISTFFSFKAGNGIGMKIVGGKTVKGTTESGAFVTAIFPGGVADQLHGELKEGNNFTYLDMYHFKL